MFDRFTDDARRAVVLAQEEARLDGAAEIAPRHLALGALAQRPVTALLGQHADTLADKLRRPAIDSQRNGRIPFTASTKVALEQSGRLSLEFDHAGITGSHVLLGAVTCGDPDVEAAVRLAGVEVAALLDGVRDLPSVAPNEPTVEQLRRYLSVPARDPDVRRRFEVQLVDALLADGDLVEARRAALAHVVGGNAESAPQLIIIGELTGDVNLIIDHGAAALDAVDGRPSYQAAYGLALAHAGRFDEARREIAAARAAAEGTALQGVILEAAEHELLAGDVDAAAELLDKVVEPDADEPLLRMLWMRLWIDVSLSRGEVTDVGPPPSATAGLLDAFFRSSLGVAQLRGAARRDKPSTVARSAAKLAADVGRLGFRGVAAEAHAVQSEALREAGKRRWLREMDQTATEFEALGRTVITERLRDRLAAP